MIIDRIVKSRIPAPKIDRSLVLNFQGDWGRTNFHRVLGWLSYEMLMLSGPHTKVGIWNGMASLGTMRAVSRGEMQIGFTTPDYFARNAFEGNGPGIYSSEKLSNLRMIGNIPHDDRLVFALRKDLGIASFDDLRKRKPKLKLSIGIDDGILVLGLAAKVMMEAAGISEEEFASWGGVYREHEEPPNLILDVARGNADGVIGEAIMTQNWVKLADSMDLVFLPIEPEVSEKLLKKYGWPTKTLPAGYLRGMNVQTPFLDFSNFAILTNTDLPEDVAYAMAWALIEQWDGIERMYRQFPPERSPVKYPLDPQAICRTVLPLHPGAERYYREAGYL